MTVTPLRQSTPTDSAAVAGLLSSFTGLSIRPEDLAPGAAGGLAERVTRPDFGAWLEHAGHTGGCTKPIRLVGSATTINAATGEVLSTFRSDDLPDRTLYTACKNRRATVCPSCATTYRYDTYHLIAAGLRGGKGVPESVTLHPAVFATFHAPSFGAVHSAPSHAHQTGYRCRPRRDKPTCPHGRPAWCMQVHRHDDPRCGQPLCLDCYQHAHQVVWNLFVPRLWDRTMTALRRIIGNPTRVKIRYAKVAEYQRRGVVHFHALIRLDGYDPDQPDKILPPPGDINADDLAHAIQAAAAHTAIQTPAHPEKPDGWPVCWGDGGRHTYADTRIVRRGVPGTELTEQHVAGYIAKYVTKGAEPAGINSGRLRETTVGIYTDPTTHVGRLVDACWRLGRPARPLRPELVHAFSGLRKWAHMLGYGGHPSTKSRAYSTTLTALRAARRPDQRQAPTAGPTAIDPTELHRVQDDQDATVVLNDWKYAGIGWLTLADHALALAAADAARSRRPAGLDNRTAA